MLRRFLPALLAASLLSACAHNIVTLDVRALDTGREREFTYEAKTGLLEGSTAEGPILRMWPRASSIRIGEMNRTVPAGCRGGLFLRRRGAEEGGDQTGRGIHQRGDRMNQGVKKKTDKAMITLCPRDGAAAGWSGWHADLEELEKDDELVALPPAVSFDIQVSETGDALIVATPTARGKVALPPLKASVFRTYPEVLGFAVITGIVPASPQGQYETIER